MNGQNNKLIVNRRIYGEFEISIPQGEMADLCVMDGEERQKRKGVIRYIYGADGIITIEAEPVDPEPLETFGEVEG